MTKKRVEKIVNTGSRQPRIDPDEVAKALGAEKCTFEELPEHIKRAAAHPLLSRRRKSDE